MWRQLLFILSFLFSQLGSTAQVIPATLYTTKDGLIADRISAITQDEKGVMWLGSYFGIGSYNGQQFEKIKLPPSQANKYVISLLSAHGNIYATFLPDGGLSVIREGKASAFKIGEGYGNEIVCMASGPDTTLFVANGYGQVLKFNQKQFQFYTTVSSQPNSMVSLDGGWLAISTGKGLFLCRNGKTETLFEGQEILHIKKDNQGKAYVFRREGKKLVVELLSGGINYRLKEIHRIDDPGFLPGRDNNAAGAWGLDYLGNLHFFENENHKVFKKTERAEVNTFFADRESNLWIAKESGLARISNLKASNFYFKELATGGGTICKINDSISLITNAKSIYKITAEGIEKVDFKSPVEDLFGDIYYDQKGFLWISYWNGGISRCRVENGKITNTKFFKKFKGQEIKVSVFKEGINGNVWASGSVGLFRINNGAILELTKTRNFKGDPAFVNCLAVDTINSMLWLGDNATGIIGIKYEPSNSVSYKYYYKYYFSSDQLPEGYIRSIFWDKSGMLWFGTRSRGLFSLKEAENHSWLLVNHNKKAAIECARITDIKEEKDGALWFASCDGAFVYREGKWKKIGVSEGMLNAEIYRLLPNGNSTYFLSGEGVASLSEQETENLSPPLISIQEISSEGKVVSEKVNRYYDEELPLSIKFFASSFLDERKNRYRYRLVGEDENWSPPTLSSSVTYASLPQGDYVFEVLASNARGEWSTTPARYSFSITRPFYKQAWFWFIGLLMLVSTLYYLRLQQINNRFRVERLRLSIARDLHDDIGSALGSINIMSSSAKRKLEKATESTEVKSIFEQIGKSAESTLDAMDDIVWAINPARDSFQDLVIRMREFANPLFESTGIEFKFSSSGNKELSIPMDIRKSCFLIYKEAIHNILKHSSASSAEVFVVLDHGISLKIEDNGKGMPATKNGSRNGLNNMESRAVSVQGSLNITSKEKGTSIQVFLPLR